MVAIGARLERAGHDQPGRGRSSRWRTRAARVGAGRRRAGGRRTCPSTCRRSTATSTRSRATRCYGPTGIGVLYGKAALLEAMPPYQGGGDMIALGHLREDDLQRAAVQVRGGHAEHRRRRSASAPRSTTRRRSASSAIARATSTSCSPTRTAAARGDPGRAHHRHGARRRPSVLSFVLDGVHPHDVGTILDREGIAVRTGHHCAQPVMDALRHSGDGPRSLALYNTREEIDALVRGAHRSAARSSADVRSPRSLPGSDPRPQPAAAQLPRARRAPTPAEGYNPLCGDQLTLYLDAGGRRHQRRRVSRARAAPSPRRRRR